MPALLELLLRKSIGLGLLQHGLLPEPACCAPKTCTRPFFDDKSPGWSPAVVQDSLLRRPLLVAPGYAGLPCSGQRA